MWAGGAASAVRGRAHSSGVLMARSRPGSSAAAAGAASARGSGAAARACELEWLCARREDRESKGERGERVRVIWSTV